MTSTANFTANPTTFCGNYSVLVAEPPGLLGALAINANHAIAPMRMHATFAPFATLPSVSVCTIGAAATASSVGCYFLPYLPDGATTMTIGGADDYFFTSMMTGCSLQVFGPAAAPTITHSNAGGTFNGTAGTLAAATAAAQIQINNMFPAVPLGEVGHTATRLDLNGAYTPASQLYARNNYPILPGYRMKDFNFDMVNTKGTNRPELGMFSFGVRNPGTGDWTFYWSASASVHGRQKSGHTHLGFIKVGVQNNNIVDEVSLGGAVQFWP